jgi:hypothetical protein
MADMLNEFCRMKGIDFQVDPRSNAERGLPPAEVRLPHWHILHYKRTGQKTPAMEQRDKERAARAEVARLEAECAELERELEAAHAAAMLAPAEAISSTAPPKMVRRPVIKTPAKRVVPEKLAAEITAPVSTDFELPGPRYGP